MGFHTLENSVEAFPANFTRLGNLAYRPNQNIIFQGSTTAIPLAGRTVGGLPSSAVTSWSLRDYTGVIVNSGGSIAAGGSWTPPAGLICGWYRLYFFGGAGAMGGGLLVVTRNVTGMSNIPTDIDGEGALGIKMMTGSYRIDQSASNPSSLYFSGDFAVDQIATYQTPFDTTKNKPNLISFPDGTAGQTTNVRAVVNRYTTVTDFEGMNEPNGVPDSTFVATMQEFYNAVKAERSSAEVLGPCPVTINASATSRLQSFGAAGGFSYCTKISFHAYNTHEGDLPLLRSCQANLLSILTQYGAQNKTRIITEAAGIFGAELGAFTPIRQASKWMMDLLGWEQFGIPKESQFPFYFKSHGFNEYPSWMSAESGQPFPIIGCIMTHSQELLAMAFEARHDFGTTDNEFVIGSSYRKADTTGVVCVMAPGKVDTVVKYQITGGSPTSLTTVDCWGNTSTASVVGGFLTTTATFLPRYFRMPAGVTATPVDGNIRYGVNRTAGATASSSTGSRGTTVIDQIVNGTNLNSLFNGVSNTTADATCVWQAGASLTAGDTVTLKLKNTSRISRILVRCPCPWQEALTSIMNADVQAFVAGSWVTVGTISQSPTYFEALSNDDDAGNSYYDSFWNDQHVFEVSFTPVVASAIRLGSLCPPCLGPFTGKSERRKTTS